jgi:hypothetical protein
VLGTAGGSIVRYRDDRPGDRERAREAVKAWRAAHPDGTPDEMLADLAGQFHPDFAPVLRALLFRTDLRDAKVTTGIRIITGEDW